VSRSFYLQNINNVITRKVNTLLKYDFKDQYPYYTLSSNQLGYYNKLIFKYNNIPKSGYIYFFSENNHGIFENIKMIDCEAVNKSKLQNEILTIKKDKIENLNFWYSKIKIENFSEYLEMLHYKLGTFQHRTNLFLNNKLQLPKQDWNFLENNIGIEFDSASTNNKLITPIIIKIK
jgi:hypothetical protein